MFLSRLSVCRTSSMTNSFPMQVLRLLQRLLPPSMQGQVALLLLCVWQHAASPHA
jgi:hypothetical protein